MPDRPFDLVSVTRLDPSVLSPVVALIGRVTEHDGMNPLSEHVWLHLKEGGDPLGRHLLATDSAGRVVAYAHLDTTDEVDGASAEIAVDPEARRVGLGRMMVEELIALTSDGRLRLWAHGEQAGAAELATGLGFRHARTLWQMRRSLYAPLPRPVYPPDVQIRPFELHHDEEPWLALNARAFLHLPDQGGWMRTDLDRRLREPWFSPEGFLMAWRGDDLVGSHWTKVHGATPAVAGGHDHQAIGEVYVVGVDPECRGLGLGRALTLSGLRHLRSLDLASAMLYVDATNTGAISLYEGLGFARWDTDVLFRR